MKNDLIKIEFWDAGSKRLENSIKSYITGIVRGKLKTIVKQYRISSRIKSTVLNDCIGEYVTALSVYSYTDANLKRKRITYLLMKARGRDPNPEGSFSKTDAMSWAESSTELTDKEIKTECNTGHKTLSGETQQHVCVFNFDISLTVNNKVLVNLEYGKTSWFGETENIKRLLFHEANEGYMFNRISLQERDEIITFADEMTEQDKKGRNRPYLKMAVTTAREKYGEKWVNLINEEVKQLIYIRYNVKKARLTIPSDMTRVIIKGDINV